jgi:hypothetical protein
MKFTERMGLKPVKSVIQLDGMDADLKNSLWNILNDGIFSKRRFTNLPIGAGTPPIFEFSRVLWSDLFKLPTDTRPRNGDQLLQKIRELYFKFEWGEVYNFIEFVVTYFDDLQSLPNEINQILARELAGYRLIEGSIVPLTSRTEIETVEKALADDKYKGVAQHFQSALDLLSNRQNPDYRNSIKESISAVESMARVVTGNPKATLGDALKVLEKDHALHGALKEGFSKLYGYTNDEAGIRHAMLEEPNLGSEDAIFFLVSCSAFTNYLKSKVK